MTTEYRKRKILFISHRIPYPPDKGDKIRSFHIVEALREKCETHLAFLIDDPQDEKHIPYLKERFASVHYRVLSRSRRYLRALIGLFSGKPLSVSGFYDPGLASEIYLLKEKIAFDTVICFSAASCEYADWFAKKNYSLITDFVDADSEKWREYAEKSAGSPFKKALFAYEAKHLLAYEKKTAKASELSLFVSDAEADLFRKIVGSEAGADIRALDNPVNTDYFSPEREFENPYPESLRDRPIFVMTGAMDYKPNAEGAMYFLKEVFPSVFDQSGVARPVFAIVGRNPSSALSALHHPEKGVIVTGGVPDVRPYLKHATVAVAPLLIARGVQNKILEAMATGTPVITSAQGFEGIKAEADKDMKVCRSLKEWVFACLELMQNPDLRDALSKNGRETMLREYSVSYFNQKLEELIVAAQSTKLARDLSKPQFQVRGEDGGD